MTVTTNFEQPGERLSAASMTLLNSHHFFASLLLNLKRKVCESAVSPYDGQPTAIVDGESIRFHPAFIDLLTHSEMVFVLAHEVMHPALFHTTRRNGRDPELWNVSGDYVINELLVRTNVGAMPKIGLRDTALYEEGNGLTDRIFEILHKSGGAPGKSLDICEDSPGAADAIEQEVKWKQRLAAAANAARVAGTMTGELERFVGSILDSRVDWRTVLQNFLQQSREDERTWARPNRRFLPMGMYLPSADGESMPAIVVLVDCSGSISDDMLQQACSEMQAIHALTRPTEVHIIYFDTQVLRHDIFEKDDEIEMSPEGGGGTAFSPVFRYLNDYAAKQALDLAACVVLTDLHCGDFGDPPEYPVLWITTGAIEAPWGEVVKV